MFGAKVFGKLALTSCYYSVVAVASNQVVGSSNLSGRAISRDDVDHSIPPETAWVCGFLSAVVYSLLVSGGPDRASVGHNQVTERRARSGSREETNRGA